MGAPLNWPGIPNGTEFDETVMHVPEDVQHALAKRFGWKWPSEYAQWVAERKRRAIAENATKRGARAAPQGRVTVMADTYDADAARREYNRAVVAAQKEAAGGPQLDGEFSADGRNTGKAFGFKYPRCSTTTKWARGILNKNGIAVTLGGAGAFTRGADGAASQRIPYKAVHVAGHQEDLTTEVPVTIPAGGTIVRGWGAARTTAIKLVLMDFLCSRADEDDEAPHADYGYAAGPAAQAAPDPIGFPDADPAPQAAPPPPPPAPAAQATPAVPDPRCAAALSALVASCKEHGAQMKDALIGVNEALAKAGRPALIQSPGCGLDRPVEVADVEVMNHYRYQLDAALAAGPGGELPNDDAAPPTAAPPPTAVAPAPAKPLPPPAATPYPTPPAPAAPPPAPMAAPPAGPAGPASAEPSAATDAGVKARWDTLFGRLRGARAKRGQSDSKFTDQILAAINGAAGHEVLSKTAPLDLATVTASRLARVEAWLKTYEEGR